MRVRGGCFRLLVPVTDESRPDWVGGGIVGRIAGLEPLVKEATGREQPAQFRVFVAIGDVDEAAREAKEFVEQSPEEAKRVEAKAKRGPGAPDRRTDGP